MKNATPTSARIQVRSIQQRAGVYRSMQARAGQVRTQQMRG